MSPSWDLTELEVETMSTNEESCYGVLWELSTIKPLTAAPQCSIINTPGFIAALDSGSEKQSLKASPLLSAQAAWGTCLLQYESVAQAPESHASSTRLSKEYPHVPLHNRRIVAKQIDQVRSSR
jgi:hypothetical protein